MHLQSLFPPVPSISATNYHHIVFPEGLLEGQTDAENYTIHVDVITGQRRSVREFTRDVYDAITALGMEKGHGGLKLESQKHRVGILSDNCMEYITIVHALIGLAVPFVPLSPFATQWELSYCLKKAEVTHVLVHKAYFSRLYLAAAELQLPDENIILFEGNDLSLKEVDQENMKRFRSLQSMVELVRTKKIPQEPIRPVQPNTLAYLIFSSGTTGSPKAVMISHENLLHSIEQLFIFEATMTKQTKEEPRPLANLAISTSLAFLPFYHTYALHLSCLRSIPRFRDRFIIMPRWNLDLALEQIRNYRINIIPFVPSIVHALLNSPKYRNIDTSSVKKIIFGAAHLSESMEKTLQTVFPNAVLSEGYALSESTTGALLRPPPTSSLSRDDSAESQKSTSTGILYPGLEALILRPDGSHCTFNEPGELYLKGGTIALGYWKDPKATAETFLPTGWLRTGDIFSVDTRGNFYFKERAKDTLKVSGLQVSPTEIEDTIYAEPSGLVKDVAVVGVLLSGSTGTSRFQDEKSPRAWIVLSEKGRQLGETHVHRVIEKWTQERLSRYKWLRGGIQFIDQIPKNPTGKVLRRVLQDDYANQYLHNRAKL